MANRAGIGCARQYLYISDLISATVRVVDAKSGIIRTVAGTPNQSGRTGDGGAATSALLYYPLGIALDGVGNLFINDYNFIREVNLNSGVIQTVAGSHGNACDPQGVISCPADQVSFNLPNPASMTALPGILYLASALETGDQSGSLMSVDLATSTVRFIAGNGIGGFIDPTNVIDNGDHLYFFDALTATVDQSSGAMGNPPIVAGTGKYGYSGDGSPATAAAIGVVGSMSLSPKGNILLWDSARIRSFSVGGNIATLAGNGEANFFGDGNPSGSAGLSRPSPMVFDAHGNLYIGDILDHAVRKIDAATGLITTIAGPGTVGNSNPNQLATQTYIQPTALALDNANHLYISTLSNLDVVDLSTGLLTTLISNQYPSQGVSTLASLAFDGNKTLYAVTEKDTVDQVSAIDVTTGTSTVIAGSGYNASNGPTGDGGPATQANLGIIWGLALDGAGNLYISDREFNNIRAINLSTGTIRTIGGAADGSTFGYSGDGGPATEAEFAVPSGLAYDGANNHLLIADAANMVIRQVDLGTGIVTTVAGNHVGGFGGDGASANDAMLFYPSGVAFDGSGNLFIADTYNDRVRRVVLHPTALTSTLTDTQSSDGSITFTATYSGLSFGIAPTGTVTFSSGGTTLGSGTLAPASDDSGTFIATITAASLPANGSTVTAQYSGDVHYATISKTLTFQQPSFTVSAAPASLSIQQGSSGSIAFTVTPQNGFHEQVSFTCDASSLPRGVTCTFSPASITPTVTSAVTTTLTVTTTGASLASIDRPAGAHSGWRPRGGAMLAFVVMLVPRVRRKAWLGAVMLLLLVSLGTLSGCGGTSSTNGTGGTQNSNSTPPGSYVIHVSSSVGSGQGAAPVSVSLTVKG